MRKRNSQSGFKVGDKVWVVSKSAGDKLESSNIVRRAREQSQYWLFVMSVNYDAWPTVARGIPVIVCNLTGKNNSLVAEGGDFFLPKDLRHWPDLTTNVLM